MDNVIAAMPDGLGPGLRQTVGRRALLFGGLALAATGAGVGLEQFLSVRPNPLDPAMQTYRLDIGRVPKAGADPVYVPEARAFLVNLEPGEGGWRDASGDQPGSLRGGLLVLSERCPYQGCAVRWPTPFPFEGRADLFRCPCCASLFTKAGLRVFGPAPRALDALAFSVDRWSGIVIHYHELIRQAPGLPQRATPLD